MQARAGTADLAVISASEIRQRALSVPWDRLGDAHAPENDRAFGFRVGARDRPDRIGVDTADLGHLFRREIGQRIPERVVALCVAADVLVIDKAFLDDGVHHGVEERDIGARFELQEVIGVPRQRVAARVHGDQCRAAPGGGLQVGRGDRMVLRRPCADDDDAVAFVGRRERCGDSARADGLHQGRDRAGMAEPGAVVDIVRPERSADQLLEEIRLFVRPLGRAEPGDRVATMAVTHFREPGGSDIQSFFPRCFAEMGRWVSGVDLVVPAFADTVLADQWNREPMRVVHIVQPEAAFYAQALLVGRAIAPLDLHDSLVLQVIGHLAADAAEGTDTVDRAVCRADAGAVLVEHGCG